MEDISPRSRRDLEFHERHGEISTISARSRQSRRVLGNLGEMEHISPRSRRDLESNKNHGEISAGGAGRPSHNALRINYIINCQLSRDPLVVSGVHGVKSTVSSKFVVKIMRFRPCVAL